MQNKTNKYARTLFDVAKQYSIIENMTEQLSAIKHLYKKEATFRLLFTSKRMTNDVKQTIIKNILSDFDNVIIEFIGILITSKQTASMINIINKFLDLSQKALNAEQVEVITAEPLADDMLASLREKMNCKVKSTVDKSIIGGMKIKYENKIFDNSIVCQLNQLKKTLHNV